MKYPNPDPRNPNLQPYTELIQMSTGKAILNSMKTTDDIFFPKGHKNDVIDRRFRQMEGQIDRQMDRQINAVHFIEYSLTVPLCLPSMQQKNCLYEWIGITNKLEAPD